MVKKTYLGRAGLVAILAAMLLVAPAMAAVNFNPATVSEDNPGFVGKGDVQTALGLNNGAMQTLAAQENGVKFTYDAVDTYAVTVEWITGEGTKGEKTHIVDIPRHVSVKSVVAYDARTHKQVDGFILTGLDTTKIEGTLPVVGQLFNPSGNANEQAKEAAGRPITAVELVSSIGGLSVNGVLLQ